MRFLLKFLFLLAFSCGVGAQPYPSRPVTFVVPFAPGGGTDITARTVAAKLQQTWGQGVVVENRGGAGGVIGTDVVAKAKPDGYTLLIANVGITSINPALYARLPYDPDKAFTPSPAMTDLMAGHVDILFASVLEGSGHIRAGKLKGLAVTHARRNPAIPEVPTIAEAGVPGGESGSWIALLAPSGTPASVVTKIDSDVRAAVSDTSVQEKLIGQGAVPQALIDKDLARYGKIIREKGLKAE